jgi:hypothetical protein
MYLSIGIQQAYFHRYHRLISLRLHLLSIVLTAADWVGPIKGAIADILHMAEKEDSSSHCEIRLKLHPPVGNDYSYI